MNLSFHLVGTDLSEVNEMNLSFHLVGTDLSEVNSSICLFCWAA